MLLDPFEKQLHLPPATIKLGDGNRRQGEVVGQAIVCRSRGLGCGAVAVEVLARVEAGKHDGLIADQSRAPVDWRLDLARVTKKLPAS